MSRVPVPESRLFVLSVNDDPTMDQEMYQWLYNGGVVIVRAHSTTKAMELLGRTHFNAVITNLRRIEFGSKNNNAGIELTQQIRRMNAHLPIIIYTMNLDAPTRQMAMHSGATLVTTNFAELQAELRKYGV